jgi:HAD superfamily hydrolase (TIGR01509 family)
MSDDSPAIELVVFDLGRVLLRISDDWDHATRLAGRPGLAGLTGDLSTAASRGEHHPLAALLDRFEIGRVNEDALFAKAAALTGHSADDLRGVMDAVVIEAFPGVTDLLDQLARLPVRTACLSNTNARHWSLFTNPGHPAFLPLDRLDFAWGSQSLGVAKPDPAIYRRVETLARTAGRHILFFDDRPENLTAAADSGWQTVLVEPQENPVPFLIQQLQTHGVLPSA